MQGTVPFGGGRRGCLLGCNRMLFTGAHYMLALERKINSARVGIEGVVRGGLMNRRFLCRNTACMRHSRQSWHGWDFEWLWLGLGLRIDASAKGSRVPGLASAAAGPVA